MNSSQQYIDKLCEFRSLFPITNDKIYLNHASTGPMSQRAKDAIIECIRVYQSQAEFDFKTYFEKLRISREIFARLLNAEPQEITFTHNTSEGIYIALINLPLKKDDEIIVMNEVFPAVRYVVQYNFPELQKKFVNLCGEDPVMTIKKHLTPRTRAVVIDHTQFFTGEMIDLYPLSEFLKENEIYLVVDGIQSIGAIEFDTRKISVDFLACGGGKWLFGPGGAGFLYVNKKNFKILKRLHTGWLGVDWKSFENFETSPPLFNDARMFEMGTRNMLGISALTEHIKILLDFGLKDVEKRVLNLKKQLRIGFNELKLPVITPENEPQSGIITIKPENPRQLYEYLCNNNVVISLRNNCLRFSPHFYNTEEEIETLFALLKKYN
ncbi:MAG: aminotransferase class V-fold PLP-dependent enzyme [candidate division WOR-3 bacterium]|nr:aminotransferase class V-fold PLP-dependent enzyme [candidate division WOR-3 bacterium]